MKYLAVVEHRTEMQDFKAGHFLHETDIIDSDLCLEKNE